MLSSASFRLARFLCAPYALTFAGALLVTGACDPMPYYSITTHIADDALPANGDALLFVGSNESYRYVVRLCAAEKTLDPVRLTMQLDYCPQNPTATAFILADTSVLPDAECGSRSFASDTTLDLPIVRPVDSAFGVSEVPTGPLHFAGGCTLDDVDVFVERQP